MPQVSVHRQATSLYSGPFSNDCTLARGLEFLLCKPSPKSSERSGNNNSKTTDHSRQVLRQAVVASGSRVDLLFFLLLASKSSRLCIHSSNVHPRRALWKSHTSAEPHLPPHIFQQQEEENAAQETSEGRENLARPARQQPQERHRMYEARRFALRRTQHTRSDRLTAAINCSRSAWLTSANRRFSKP